MVTTQKIIDIHSHLFNLKYLPVGGIIARYTNNFFHWRIVAGVEWLLIKSTESDFEAAAKSFKASRYASAYMNMPAHEVAGDGVIPAVRTEKEQAVDNVAHLAKVGDLENTPLGDAIEEFVKTFGDPADQAFLAAKSGKSLASPDMVTWLYKKLEKMIAKIIEVCEDLVNYFKWFRFMTHSETDIYERLSKVDAVNVECYLHMMMDVDHFFKDHMYNGSSYFDFEKQQIDNMKALSDLYPGKLIGFVAFNPSRVDPVGVVRDAIQKKGFKGIKFYPPLGYRADGDLVYGEKITELLQFCIKNDTPLFTHCNNQGFEANRNAHSGYESNPKYWESALIKYPALRLCFGHAGGGEGWFTQNLQGDRTDPATILGTQIKDDSAAQKDWNKSYAAMVYKLCVTYPNVYCDASYLDELMLSNGSFAQPMKDNFKERLLKLFTRQTPAAQYNLSKKIMYGSDWHMLFQEGKNEVYLQCYLNLFDETELKPYKDDFFYNNAKAYLQI